MGIRKNRKWKVKGVPVPLFDRLTDTSTNKPEEDRIHQVLSKRELMASIQIELTRILNTRCTVDRKTYDQFGPVITSYGVPEFFGLFDLSGIDATDDFQKPKLEKLLKRAIEAYEPRVTNVRVHVIGFHNKQQSLSFQVEADVIIGDVLEPVSFPIDVEGYTASNPDIMDA